MGIKKSKVPYVTLILQTFIPTTSYWAPNYNKLFIGDMVNGTLVRLSFFHRNVEGGWQLAVWGADDEGVELLFPENEELKAREMARFLMECGPISKKDLIDLGFKQA